MTSYSRQAKRYLLIYHILMSERLSDEIPSQEDDLQALAQSAIMEGDPERFIRAESNLDNGRTLIISGRAHEFAPIRESEAGASSQNPPEADIATQI